MSALMNTPDYLLAVPPEREPRIGDWLGFSKNTGAPCQLDFAHRSYQSNSSSCEIILEEFLMEKIM
jgi:hypothetical protein